MKVNSDNVKEISYFESLFSTVPVIVGVPESCVEVELVFAR
jgi:hypothetical protein